MQVGIIEICEPNHYTAVNALAQTYAVNNKHKIIIFTLKEIAPLFITGKNISLQVKQDEESIADFLNKAAAFGCDRLHINTLSSYFDAFAKVNWTSSIWFSIHNIDIFFANKQLHRLRLLFFEWGEFIKERSLKGIKNALMIYLKDFSRQQARNEFMAKLRATDYKIIVYSTSQEKYLQQYIAPEKIVVFPFCLYDNMTDLSVNNTKLRICIPGSVTNRRRDYDSLLIIINKNLEFFKDHVVIDMLGYIPQSDIYLAHEFKKLNGQGVEIIYNLDFIDSDNFDKRLSTADIILGNLKVQIDPYRKYGETKETGVIFNVIKAGKPALLPKAYAVDDELQQICLFYNDYDELYDHIKTLAHNNNSIKLLKEKVSDIVKNYTPEKLYHLLAN